MPRKSAYMQPSSLRTGGWTDKRDERDSRALQLLRERAKKRSSFCELGAN
jgi:hypothetical protein